MKKLLFAPESTGFYKELRENIDQYFKNQNKSKTGGKEIIFKISFLLIVYVLAYISIFYFTDMTYTYIVYSFIGGWSILLGLNIGHDAAHNTIFKKKKYNKHLLLVFELLGTSSYNWVNRHIGAHHLFPNVMDLDSDIQQTNMVKIFPNDKHLKIHALQHLYMPFLYMFYILRWIVYRDFKDASTSNIGVFDNSKFPRKELLKMIASKAFYLFYMVVIPSYVLNVSIVSFLLAFLILTFSGSLVITFVLLSTHVGEDANFPKANEEGVLPHSWSYHQLITTSDFSTNNKTINFLFGGFNHHVIHHLFPNICHVHYPELTKILKSVAIKYDAPYSSEKYLVMAIYSHFKLLKKNSYNLTQVDHA